MEDQEKVENQRYKILAVDDGNGGRSARMIEQQQTAEVRDYNLNKPKAMKKKLSATEKIDVKITETGGGIKIEFNAGFYELFKSAAQVYYSSSVFGKTCKEIPVTDKLGRMVEMKYKLFAGSRCHKYTLNLYHTKCSCLVNGKEAEEFVHSDLPDIIEVIANRLSSAECSYDQYVQHIKQAILRYYKENQDSPPVEVTKPMKMMLESSANAGGPIEESQEKPEEDSTEYRYEGNADDSITYLKEVNNTKDEELDAVADCTNNLKHECIEHCQLIGKNNKKSKNMTRCNFCMNWFHDACVGISKFDPVGFWVCLQCRALPNDLKEIKNSLQTLETSTKEIMSQVEILTREVELKYTNICDTITGINKTMAVYDESNSTHFQDLKRQTQNLKAETTKRQRYC